MTKMEYLEKLDKIMEVVVKVTENTKETRDHIEILKLQLAILEKTYELTKEEE